MTRRYVVKRGGGSYDVQDGETVELDLSPDVETELVNRGVLEVAPRKYKVVGESEVYETPPGETFEVALPAGQEAALMAGAHIELAPGPSKSAAPDKAKGGSK